MTVLTIFSLESDQYKMRVFAKTNPQLDFNSKLIPKLESNAKLT